MQALVLESTKNLAIREIDLPQALGPHDVRIAIHTVGICGSDLHYYHHGAIGPFVVNAPMVLGHEASGTVVETGSAVTTLKVGDRVCMEPGIPNPHSKATRLGIYNLDPDVQFWATPPVHGCLLPHVVHPEAFTFKLPESISYAEGALVEPLATGIHAANKAKIHPGDTAVVIGAGTIGALTVLAALASGCGQVFVADIEPAKLEILSATPGIVPVQVPQENLVETVHQRTDGWGVDLVFEATGSPRVFHDLFKLLRPGGAAVLIGMPGQPIPIDIVEAQAKEIRLETVFRYAHVYPRALALMASGKINVAPMASKSFAFQESIQAFDFASSNPKGVIKTQIVMEGKD